MEYKQDTTDVLSTCAALARAGMIAGTSGNVSARISDEMLITTPAGRSKGRLRADELVKSYLDGRAVDEDTPGASSEIKMHLALYAAAPWIGGVVHAHPIHATALTFFNERVDLCITAEGAAAIGPIARVPYMTPGSKELAVLVAAAAASGARAILLENHGAVTIGETLEEALCRLESLEHVAKLWVTLRAQGALEHLPVTEVQALRAKVGLSDERPTHVYNVTGAPWSYDLLVASNSSNTATSSNPSEA